MFFIWAYALLTTHAGLLKFDFPTSTGRAVACDFVSGDISLYSAVFGYLDHSMCVHVQVCPFLSVQRTLEVSTICRFHGLGLPRLYTSRVVFSVLCYVKVRFPFFKSRFQILLPPVETFFSSRSVVNPRNICDVSSFSGKRDHRGSSPTRSYCSASLAE